MDGRRLAQFGVLLAAVALVVFGVTQFGTARARIAPVIVTIGLVFVVAVGVLLYSGRGGSPVADAPGHGVRLDERHLLHDAVAGVAGAPSYELDLYGSAQPGAAMAGELGDALGKLGYRRQPPTPGPTLQTNATEVAQFGLDRWRWRVYELPLPTRFAGANYSTRDFAHLVAVTVSDDGSPGAVPSPDQPPPVLLDTGATRVASTAPDSGSAAPLGGVTFRDTIFETQLRLTAGDDNDRYGVFVRRSATGRFVSCCISPAGVLAIRLFDGTAAGEVAGGDLAPGMTFAPGLDAANVFHVVACGPQLTFVLNGMVLMGLTVSPTLAEGELGVLVEHGRSSPEAAAEADWAQVRAVLPPMRRS